MINYEIKNLLLISSCVETKKDIIVSPSIQNNVSSSKPENLVVSSIVPSNNPSLTSKEKVRPKVDAENSILILIDTHLLVDKFKVFMSTEEVNKYPRKVYVLKESYDNLDQTDLDQLNKEYQDYKIYDPNKDILDMKNSEGDLGYKENEKTTCTSFYTFYSFFRDGTKDYKYTSPLINIDVNDRKDMLDIVNKFPEFFKDYPQISSDSKYKYIETHIDPPEYSINVSVKNVNLKDLYKNIYNYNKNKQYDEKIREIKVSSIRGAKYQTIKYALLSNYNLFFKENEERRIFDFINFNENKKDPNINLLSKIECDKLSEKNYEDGVKNLKELNPDYIYAPTPNYDDL